jgi:hypothetical protein
MECTLKTKSGLTWWGNSWPKKDGLNIGLVGDEWLVGEDDIKFHSFRFSGAVDDASNAIKTAFPKITKVFRY